MSDLKILLYSHSLGWAPIGDIEKMLEKEGFTFTALERNNRTDGEWHKRISKDGKHLELNANVWVNSSFDPLIDWYERI